MTTFPTPDRTGTTTAAGPAGNPPPVDGLDAILVEYRRSLDAMDHAVRSADPTRWDDPSPCEDWTARQVLGHVISFLGSIVALGTGADDGDDGGEIAGLDPGTVVGDDPVAAWADLRRRVEDELLTRADRLALVRMTPLGVEMPLATLLTFHGMDPLVHAWDVATATGSVPDLPDELAERYLERFAPLGDQLRELGRLGPPLDGGVTAADRLLDFCGRRR